jgi:hypothetical protein
VRRITVGPLNAAEPVIALLGSGMGGVDDGLLGLGFLRRFGVWIDFDRRVMYRQTRHLATFEDLSMSHSFLRSDILHENKS